jgi:hypothetical protein
MNEMPTGSPKMCPAGTVMFAAPATAAGDELLAIVGALLGAQALDAGRTQRTEAVFAVGDQVQTSLGFLTVGQVEDLNGLTSQDLNGVTHGIQNLVLEDEAQM